MLQRFLLPLDVLQRAVEIVAELSQLVTQALYFCFGVHVPVLLTCLGLVHGHQYGPGFRTQPRSGKTTTPGAGTIISRSHMLHE